jgi:hypothetical protein
MKPVWWISHEAHKDTKKIPPKLKVSAIEDFVLRKMVEMGARALYPVRNHSTGNILMKYFFSLISAIALVGSSAYSAEGDGWRPLFNGKDLTGWVPVQVAPKTFTVRDGIIVSTGVPTGVMRTDRQYENFELELEWKHVVPEGNAGLFIWSAPITAVGQPFTKAIEVQILDGRNNETYTSHGDIFAIHGAHMKPDRPHPKGWERCLPSEFRCKPAGEWNHYRVDCNNGVIKLSVNGKEVSGGSACTPRKGYICLESEGTECHFRNIRIKELPSTNPKPEETAPLDEGFVSLYNGLNFDGWEIAPQGAKWKANDWILENHGGVSAIISAKMYTNYTLIFDWRIPKGDPHQNAPNLYIDRGTYAVGAKENPRTILFFPDLLLPPNLIGNWNRSRITVQGGRCTVEINDSHIRTVERLTGGTQAGKFGIGRDGARLDLANIYIKELK